MGERFNRRYVKTKFCPNSWGSSNFWLTWHGVTQGYRLLGNSSVGTSFTYYNMMIYYLGGHCGISKLISLKTGRTIWNLSSHLIRYVHVSGHLHVPMHEMDNQQPEYLNITVTTIAVREHTGWRWVSATHKLSEHTELASFPGSPLALMKNKNGGGEPGIDSHVILWHDDVIAIIAKAVAQLCSHVMGWFKQLRYLLLKNWAVTSLVRPWHGLNSSDSGEVSSI